MKQTKTFDAGNPIDLDNAINAFLAKFGDNGLVIKDIPQRYPDLPFAARVVVRMLQPMPTLVPGNDTPGVERLYESKKQKRTIELESGSKVVGMCAEEVME